MCGCVLIKWLANVLGQHVANRPTGTELTASRTYVKLLFFFWGGGGERVGSMLQPHPWW